MRKFLSVAVAAAVTLGAAAAVTSSAGASPSAPSAGGYTPPPIHWHKCYDPSYNKAGFQCGKLTVPLNYAKPNGRKIKLAVSRIVHSKGAHYKGVMLTNPGGPGGSGLVLPILRYYVPNNVGADYDWIGFDPRGVGRSQPSLSCNRHFFHVDRPPYRPTKKIYYRHWINRSKQYAAQCAHAKNSALFNHVKTVDTVNDMESLRKALGVAKISYYGFSYGTYIGQVFMTEHPDQVRRFVLDSSVDPKRAFYQSNQDQDVAFQKTFNIYFHWLAKYHSVYHVGRTFKAVRGRWIATRKALDRHAANGRLGGDEFIDDFTSAGYYVYGWEDIAKAYSAYLNKGNATPLIRMYTSANPTSAGGDNGYAIYLGTQCTDAAWPHSQAKLNADNRRLDKKHTYFTWSNAWFNGPCAYWKFPARQRVDVTGAKVKNKILMIDETYDAATPYKGNLVVRKLFPTASLIQGKDGSTHAGSLSGVACTDDTIARYLNTGAVPARKKHYGSDKTCPPVPQPNPTQSAAQQQHVDSPDGRSVSAISSLNLIARSEIVNASLIGR